MNYSKSTLALVTLFAIGSINAMEPKKNKKAQKKQQQAKPVGPHVKPAKPQMTPPTPQNEYRQVYDQLRKLKPSANDYFMLENIQYQVQQQSYEALKQEARPSGKLTQQQSKELQDYLKSEVDKNIETMRNDIFPASIIRDSATIKNIAKNCIMKFPQIELGDFETILLPIFNRHPKNLNMASGPSTEQNKRGTIAKAFFTAQKELS